MNGAPRYVCVVAAGGAPAADTERTVRSLLDQEGDLDVIVTGRVPRLDDGRLRAVPAATDVWQVGARSAGADGFVVAVEPGDALRPGALAHVSAVLSDDVDIVYTDERVHQGDRSCDRFKPDWSPERARCHDYCGQLSAFRGRTLSGIDVAVTAGRIPRHAALLHAAERARRIEHVPVVAFDRYSAVPAPAVRTHPPVDHRVTVVIPTVGATRAIWGRHRPLVLEAVDSVLAVTQPRPQIVVVVDPATPPSVRQALAVRDVVLVAGVAPFNYAAACNLGAAAADGEVIVLLNDDTKVEDVGWLAVMTSLLAEPDVGVVGARLLHADGTLQHGGLLLNGQPLHIFHGYAGEDPGPFDLLRVDREVSAVTGACLATPRSLWRELGWLDPAFALAGNDVDYCLRAQRRGRRVVWTPDATLYHFESQSRGVDTAPADVALLCARWPEEMSHDRFGHPDFEPRQAEWVPRQALGLDQRVWRSLHRAARWRPGSRH